MFIGYKYTTKYPNKQRILFSWHSDPKLHDGQRSRNKKIIKTTCNHETNFPYKLINKIMKPTSVRTLYSFGPLCH